jgi:hypothetical protein
MGGFKTRKKDGICKIIVDIPEQDYTKFKTICKIKGYTIKDAVWNMVRQFNVNKIKLDVTL